MRTAITLLASLAALSAAPAAASAADARPLPEIQCGFAGCPDPVGGVRECATNAVGALILTINGTPWMTTCDPMGRS